jgi:alkanesulfonate monooxygenase SsuD/methylene tetrahydromethanopterin reductase-like flavin-dependent oxidoreductase (luciferase family)
LGEIDIRATLGEAHRIVAEIEGREKRLMRPELRAELLTLVAEEIQDAARRGSPETARERIDRWWALTGGTR